MATSKHHASRRQTAKDQFELAQMKDGLAEDVLTSVHVSWIECFSQIQDILLQGEVAERNFVGSTL